MTDVVHLASSIHDVTCQTTDVWCSPMEGYRNETQHIEKATCHDCLKAAHEYGCAAERRRVGLLYMAKHGMRT